MSDVWRSARDYGAYFVTCCFVQMVSQLVSQWCKLQPIFAFRVRDLLDLHLYVGGSAKFKKAIHAICHTAFWCIWRCRNAAVFKHKRPSMQTVMGDIKGMSFLWVKARSKQRNMDWDLWNCFNILSTGW
ncbi:hypothetical protein HanRHA438_Chr06g0270621 [Helianthus annuus]|uniref:RNA-directed DNA polymerase, eukaryota, Reverse transcriptase zinc-binding domain protein n=1 Tax=Helianthus annuus TaxID=4232 RepID=A0A9K3IT47_HELAN|nr:hypothetical protein HanXRQr2_Chr06g0261561 [Helianthus annuus]KAJ0560720.1 hypothetical protein HanHA300_Chr06g0214501 [Helianthus annuus]KAJ0573755.1 hypothetical protein HanHA89_Chr06g0230261 [Helianthus annuus]KAJ0912113.1 hypothetical protein HanRHA438_Chr06g0270621 [Helianthus annuus]KAJ0915656.1 hypothetical protein HanPSC8_Chr06g0252331 [Helianthus annuus]